MSYTKPFKVLDSIINDIESDIKKFVNNPEKDFTRKRKLDFKTMIKLMISMEGGSIQKELFEYFKYDVATDRRSQQPEDVRRRLSAADQTWSCTAAHRKPPDRSLPPA